MPLADHANHIRRPVNDNRKQVGDVAAEHTHVKGRDFGERRKLTSKGDSPAVFTQINDLGLDTDGGAHPTYPGKLIGRSERRQLKGLQNIRTENGTVRTDVDEKTRLHPGAVASQYLAAKDRSSNAVIAQVPHATNELRCELAFPWE